jgi:hypothetical protein
MVSARYEHFCYSWIVREARKKPAMQENLGEAKTTSSSPHSSIFTNVRNVCIVVDTTKRF